MKSTMILRLSLMLTFSLFATILSAQAQDTTKVVPTISLSGPRVGITYLPAQTVEDLNDFFDISANPIITQFGWQFEAQYFKLPSGTAGLVEGVLLIGGLEQGLFLPSGTLLVGLRERHGLEFGFGPNLSLSGAAFAIAAGFTLHSGDINFPFNLAIVPSQKGIRTSLLIGFNARKK